MNHHIIKRLAFIKYLYVNGINQSKEPEPYCFASILTMHDAVELFLQLSLEHLAPEQKTPPNFMEYWSILNRKLQGQELSQKASMERLNKARVSLKHQGIYPAKDVVDSFRSNLVSFFEENTPLIFDRQIGEISLIEFVYPDSARQRLYKAEDNLKNDDVESALGEIAIAFIEVIRDYEFRKSDRFRRSPFDFSDYQRWPSTFEIEMEITRDTGYHQRISLGKFGDFIDNVAKSITTLQDAIRILALGLDYRKYVRFIRLVPEAAQNAAGDWFIQPIYRQVDFTLTMEDVQFCLDFVIECSLGFGEFDNTGTRPND